MNAIIIILFGAFIGYITNKIAIMMMFRPYTPKKYLFCFEQGVVPKSKEKLADVVSTLIEKKLLPSPQIIAKLRSSFPAIELIELFFVDFCERAVENLNIKELSRESIINFSNAEIEQCIRDVSNKYFFHLEVLGGVLGGLIAGAQVCLLAL